MNERSPVGGSRMNRRQGMLEESRGPGGMPPI